MSPDTLRPRFQLTLGALAVLGEELPALRGRRVYAADAPSEGRRLTVTLHPAPPEGPDPRALQEKVARFTALGHGGVVLPLAMGEFEGRAWVVESDDGITTVRERLHERGPLPVSDGVRVVRDVARALAAMHRRGLTHGGVRLETVLLAPEGTLLAGVALQLGGSATADLDALGTMAQALFHGEPPDGSRLRRRLPPEIATLLDAMASTEPARRPQRAEAILGVLDAFPVGSATALGAIIDSAGRGARRHGRHATLGLLALGGVILLVVLWLVTRP